MKKETKKPHFVKEIRYSKDEPWRTDYILGQRESKDHGHLALSGAAILYLRDEEGNEIILDGEIKEKKEKNR